MFASRVTQEKLKQQYISKENKMPSLVLRVDLRLVNDIFD